MKKLLCLSLFFIVLNLCFGQTNDISKDSIKTLIDEYYDLNLKVMQQGSTQEDIDSLFQLFHQDFEYEHSKYGGIYSREVLYNGYKNNLDSGNYNGRVIYLEINQLIIGVNIAATEKRFITRDENNIISKGEWQMTVFEFKDGGISKIIEYW